MHIDMFYGISVDRGLKQTFTLCGSLTSVIREVFFLYFASVNARVFLHEPQRADGLTSKIRSESIKGSPPVLVEKVLVSLRASK